MMSTALTMDEDNLRSDRLSARLLLAPVVNLTVVAGENLTVGSGSWLPAASVAPGR